MMIKIYTPYGDEICNPCYKVALFNGELGQVIGKEPGFVSSLASRCVLTQNGKILWLWEREVKYEK